MVKLLLFWCVQEVMGTFSTPALRRRQQRKAAGQQWFISPEMWKRTLCSDSNVIHDGGRVFRKV
jgi:hypothetical protein